MHSKNLPPVAALIIALVLSPFFSAMAQVQWANRIASTTSWPDGIPNFGLALDTNDNCYVTGFFDDTNSFGGITLTNQSVGGNDIFVAKYNSTGALQWVQQAGGTAINTGRAIGVDTNGNVYVTGGYGGSASFGGIGLPTTSGEEFYLAKYNNAGAVQWVQACTNGSSSVDGLGMAVDGAGNCYALVSVDYLGGLATLITFGSQTVNIPANNGSPVMILVKYNNTGIAQWAQLMGGSNEVYATKVAVDISGNVYVRGTFYQNLTIGTSNLVVSAGSSENMFIAKFNDIGSLTWVQQPQGGNVGEGGVTVDPAGNVYVSGYFDTNLSFGNGISLTNMADSSSLFGDAFLAKYNSAGSIKWAQPAGGTNGGFYWDLSLDAQTNIYASGFLGYNAAVAKYSPAGTLQWMFTASGTPASPVASGLVKCVVDSGGNCFLAGFYQGTNTFGANLLIPQETENFFIAEKTFAPILITTNAAISCQAGVFTTFSGSNYLAGIQGDGTTSNKITAQLFSTNGMLTGPRIAVGRTGGIPYVANGNTNFLVVWPDNALVAGGGHDQVYGQFISRSGTLVGSAFTFGPSSEEQDMQGGSGNLLAFDGNNFLTVWDTGAFHNATNGNVHAALFNQSGSIIGSIIFITSGANTNLTPVVTFGKTNYLVAWNDVSTGNIDGKIISTNGTQGSSFVINQTTTPSYNPCCIGFDGTNFLVVWNKDITGNQVWNLYGRLVSPTGSPLGNEVAMVTDTNNPVYPSIAFNGTNYLMSWFAKTSSQIQFQFFNQAAIPVGVEFNLFSPQGTNSPLFAGVLSAGNQFETTAVIGGISALTSEGFAYSSGTTTWGTFQNTTPPLLPPPPLVVTTTSLPNATNGVAYSQTLEASGGNSPYTWTNILGSLPTGLTLGNNGLISGTPTTNGTFIFTVKVTAAAIFTATEALSLTVGSVPVVNLQPTNSSVSVTVGSNISFTVSVMGTGPFTYQWQINGNNFPNNGIITTLAGNGTGGYYGDGGAATNAELFNPDRVSVDSSGNDFIADLLNNRIREVRADGIITTAAGNGTGGYSGDGGAATNAELNWPGGVTVDSTGNLYIAEINNNTIRKVLTNGIIFTLAGNGIPGYSGDAGAATNAELNQPYDVALDASGNIYIADNINNVIRRVGTNGIITTVAGSGTSGFSGDGGAATNAELNSPTGVTIDQKGNLIIADFQNNVVRRVGTNGVITTVAGNGTGGYSGDGGAATNAELNWPGGVTVDGTGNLYIADFQNNAIRKVGTDGIITTVAGNGMQGYTGDGDEATNSELYNPTGVTLDPRGNLIISDYNNNVIRQVAISGPTLFLSNLSLVNSGAYDVVVTSPYGCVTSSVVNLTVTYSILPVILSSPQIAVSKTIFTFLLSGPAGSNYLLQASTNLSNWIPVSTSSIPVSGSINISNAISGSKQGFYRVHLQ